MAHDEWIRQSRRIERAIDLEQDDGSSLPLCDVQDVEVHVGPEDVGAGPVPVMASTPDSSRFTSTTTASDAKVVRNSSLAPALTALR